MNARAPLRFEIPANARQQSCLSCGQAIFFIETPRGRRAPVNPDGTVHFVDCKDAAKFRGKSRAELREQGELFGGKKPC